MKRGKTSQDSVIAHVTIEDVLTAVHTMASTGTPVPEAVVAMLDVLENLGRSDLICALAAMR